MQKAVRKEQAGLTNPVSDLRSTLEWLRQQGDLIETDKEVDPDLEVTGLQKHLDGGCPVLFNKVKGKPHHACSPTCSATSRSSTRCSGGPTTRIEAQARLCAVAIRSSRWRSRRTRHPAGARDRATRRRQQIRRADPPHGDEPELTVGSGIRCVTGAYFDGGSDLGYNRMNFRWGNVGTFQISPGSHMWQVVNKYYQSKQPVPITMCFGVPPACTLLAGAGFDYAVLPMGCDEIGIAGAVQGTPIRLVKARTVERHGDRRFRAGAGRLC